MNPCPDSATRPPPMQWTVQNFKRGQPLTYRVIGGIYHHRLGNDAEFVSTGNTNYPAAAAHDRRRHGLPAIGGRAA